jgi:hypothetical protein
LRLQPLLPRNSEPPSSKSPSEARALDPSKELPKMKLALRARSIVGRWRLAAPVMRRGGAGPLLRRARMTASVSSLKSSRTTGSVTWSPRDVMQW